MTIEETLDALFKDDQLTVYPKAAKQNAPLPFTTYRAIEDEPLNVLSGFAGITRTDFIFESWALTQEDANTARDAVAASVHGAGLNSYQLPGGEAGFDEALNAHMAPCAFSIWH